MRKFSQIQLPFWLLKTIAKLCLKQKQKMLNLVTNPVTNLVALSKYYCKNILRIKAMLLDNALPPQGGNEIEIAVNGR